MKHVSAGGNAMEIPLQITSRNIELSGSMEQEIREKVDKLETFYQRIMRCRVVVEAPHRHKHEGLLYNVRIEMTLPGGEVVVKREPNEDIYVAIRNSFDSAYRRLEEYAKKQRGDIKRREGPPQARVGSLFPDRGYGFLTTDDGREIYFHRNSVVNDNFGRLKVGALVRFVEEQGEKGPQASSVSVS